MSNNPPQASAPGLDKAWTIAQRNVEQRRRRGVQPKECPLCNGQLRTDTRDELQRHFDRHHPLETNDEAAVSERKALIDDTFENFRDTAHDTTTANNQTPLPADTERDRAGNDERSLPPRRSRARQPPTGSGNNAASSTDEYRREPMQKSRQLWSPDDDSPAGRQRSSKHRDGAGGSATSGRSFESRSEADNSEVMLKQPETRPISQEQLVAEVKGIYAGLVMVESKCIEVDNAQNSSNSDTNTRLNHDQWKALIALHRTLLHEHHDFFLASQHPSASPALRRLASKYAMPARMWRHGIHSFLELLRHRLPTSLEHMLTFIYLAYSMMALLYETVPAFEDTWIECLGDLGRYRMAIEDDDLKDREIWTAVSRHWYSKASEKAPTTGRLYHHLAILARPNALQQLFYYSKSLCVPIPFLSARESIMTLFEPHLNKLPTRLLEIDASFVRAHGVLFSGRNTEDFAPSVDEFISLLDNHIARTTRRWMDCGYHIGIALGCAILEYGSESNAIMQIIKSGRPEDVDVSMEGTERTASKRMMDAVDFAARTHNVIFRRFGDDSVNTYVHVTLAFLFHMSHYPAAMELIEESIPWKLISLMLNTLLGQCSSFAKVEGDEFPRPLKDTPRPLPDDYAQRGLLWVDKYYPDEWFSAKIEDEEKYFEVASMKEERTDRCIWLGCQLARSGKWLTYDNTNRQFGFAPKYDVNIDGLPAPAKETSAANDGDVEIPDAPAANNLASAIDSASGESHGP